jgi:hypothetical protein
VITGRRVAAIAGVFAAAAVFVVALIALGVSAQFGSTVQATDAGTISGDRLTALVADGVAGRASALVHLEILHPDSAFGRIRVDGAARFTAPLTFAVHLTADSFDGDMIQVGSTSYLKGTGIGTATRPWLLVTQGVTPRPFADLASLVRSCFVAGDVTGVLGAASQLTFAHLRLESAAANRAQHSYGATATTEQWLDSLPTADRPRWRRWAAAHQVRSADLSVVTDRQGALTGSNVILQPADSAQFMIDRGYL